MINSDAQFVRVLWNDACESDDNEHTLADLCEQEACGFLVKHDDKTIVVARDYNSLDEDYLAMIRIPTGMILEIQYLH